MYEAYYLRGVIRLIVLKDSNAIDDLRTAGKNIDNPLYKNVIKSLLGDTQSAIRFFKKEIKNPNSTFEKMELHYYLACIYGLQNESKLAIEQLKIAIKNGLDTKKQLQNELFFDNIREDEIFINFLTRNRTIPFPSQEGLFKYNIPKKKISIDEQEEYSTYYNLVHKGLNYYRLANYEKTVEILKQAIAANKPKDESIDLNLFIENAKKCMHLKQAAYQAYTNKSYEKAFKLYTQILRINYSDKFAAEKYSECEKKKSTNNIIIKPFTDRKICTNTYIEKIYNNKDYTVVELVVNGPNMEWVAYIDKSKSYQIRDKYNNKYLLKKMEGMESEKKYQLNKEDKKIKGILYFDKIKLAALDYLDFYEGQSFLPNSILCNFYRVRLTLLHGSEKRKE